MTTPWWRHPLMVDAALIALALTDTLSSALWELPLDALWTALGALGLVLRRRLPWVSLVLALPAVLTSAGSLAALIAVFSIAERERRLRVSILAGAVVFAASYPSWWGWSDAAASTLSVVYALTAAAAPVAVGLLVRTRRELAERVGDLEDARRAEREHERDEILAAERARIAREMHDVVSHQVSLIAVQAGALQVSAPEDATRGAARTIRELAVRTLNELRQMVAVLRAGGAEVESLAPQPTLADLDRLVRDSGVRVTARIAYPADVSPAVQRAVYRTAQEALTNARKHAPGANCTLELQQREGALELRVSNRLSAEGPAGLPGGGTGIIGLRERAALLGGTLETGWDAESFTITARFPLA